MKIERRTFGLTLNAISGSPYAHGTLAEQSAATRSSHAQGISLPSHPDPRHDLARSKSKHQKPLIWWLGP